MRAKRFILLLDPRYPEEQEALDTIKAAPKGEGAAFLRALMLIGYGEIKKRKALEQSSLLNVKANTEPAKEMNNETGAT